MSAGRKIFRCVVDDTALTTNISEIKKWTSSGAITLIVPLYTLERLRALKRSGSQIGMNAREAVRFLDRVTSGKHEIPSSRIALQGPMELFETWEAAEKYFLPEFEEDVEDHSEGDADSDEKAPHKDMKNGEAETEHTETANPNEMSQLLLSKLNFKKEPDAVSVISGGTGSNAASLVSGSSHTSPKYMAANLAAAPSPKSNVKGSVNSHRRSASGSVIPSVPATIKPLLSAVLWRLHCQPGATPGVNRCILITNDLTTQTWAQKFGITTKNIHQLRTAIIYEEKEFKNHCKYIERNQSVEPERLLSYEDESDEDVLVFVPRGPGKSASRGTTIKRPATHKSAASNRVASTNMNGGNVKTKSQITPEAIVEVPSTPIDPNSFSRNFGTTRTSPPAEITSSNESLPRAFSGSSPRGQRRGAPRGIPLRGSTRGRGKLWVP
ncbi:PIN superfamily domain-containing protein [Histoplasma capsulatum]|uniref:PIN superfamily domain-containing protein n=1 Tax=Ajellomyces capsulatus TaxID=5037 RepID=A0A8A1MEF4_AJECA|nr:PIN superfamily domain-containing protein [Histoplasma capsulatum]